MTSSPDEALENLDRMFDQVVSVSNKTVQARMKRAKQRNTAKRRRHSNPVTKR